MIKLYRNQSHCGFWLPCCFLSGNPNPTRKPWWHACGFHKELPPIPRDVCPAGLRLATWDAACLTPGAAGGCHPSNSSQEGTQGVSLTHIDQPQAQDNQKCKYCPSVVLSQYFELLPGLFDDSQRLEVTYLLMVALGVQEAGSAIIHATVQLGLFADRVCQLQNSFRSLLWELSADTERRDVEKPSSSYQQLLSLVLLKCLLPFLKTSGR